jgi:KDO2-lipid IV(A) lauroyltransferase
MGAHLSARGYPLRSLARPLREERLESRLRRHRESMGVHTLSARDGTRSAVRHLRRGGLLGVLIDQRVRSGGVTVPFLGQPTRMVDGPARLALATGAPVVPGGVYRDAGNRHRVVLDPPILPDPGAADPVTDLTARLAAALERRIHEHPDQWMWIHPRWEPVPETRR